MAQRKIHVALWSARDDTRAAELAALMESAQFQVHDCARVTDRVDLILLLPGGGSDDLEAVCTALAQRHPSTPTVLLHSSSTQVSYPRLDKAVFETLPASLPLEKMVEHLLGLLARWSRIERLKASAVTLQQLESTLDLVYFDFRPETGTFLPSKQLGLLVGLEEPRNPMTPSPFLECIHSEDRAAFAATLFEASRNLTPFCLPIRLTDAHGRKRHFRARGRAFGPIESGASTRVFGVCEDTTDHMQRIAEAEERSRIDELTGLGNRRFFNDCLATAIKHSDLESELMALLYVDLDRFKLINDTLGHDAGDRLLRVISARLEDAVRANDVVCHDHDERSAEARVSRLGGDEFTVLLTGIHGRGDAELVANRMLEAMSQPVEIEGHSLNPSASIGIACFPEDGRTTDDLRKRADAALYAAKDPGGTFRFFDQSMEDVAIRRLSLEAQLRKALETDAFELFFQPRIDFRTRKIVGAEALIQWTSPSLGRIRTEEITRIATDAGLIVDLGRWTLRRACREAVRWPGLDQPACRLSINIATGQFHHDDLFSAVTESLRESGLAPSRLDLEITDSLLLRPDPTIAEGLEELRRIGTRIVLDEFGKGSSALADLLNQPIDVLKLDRRLIDMLEPGETGSQILSSILRMGQDLSLGMIGAGVEREEQARFLAEQGCFEMEGVLFSAPLRASEFSDLLKRR